MGRIAAVFLVIAGAALLISSETPAYSPSQKAFYADPNLVNFVRPGLVTKITWAEIVPDGTIRARVKVTDPQGLPLDREGIQTPGAVSMSLVAAYLPKDADQYVAYTVRTQTSPITNVSAVQASSDSGGTWQKVADGEYQYTFKTKATAGYDRTATHSIGVYASRNLTEFDLGTQYDDDVYNFVPAGGEVTKVRDIIRTESCNKCHSFDEAGLHGGTRKTMEMCNLCHTPQTIDPDTGESMDMPILIHKIHMGAHLPSVIGGKPYIVIGNRQSVHDYSHVEFPTLNQETPAPVDCAACHERGNDAATQKTAHLTNPTRAACGACHDNVNFATGENHAGLPQLSDNQCANCHQVEGEYEFDLSIKGAHAVPELSKTREGINFEILEVTGKAGEKPTVKFSVKNNAGAPIPLSDFTVSPGRLGLVLAGPTTPDYGYVQFGNNRPVGYVSENPVPTASCAADGVCTYTFNNAIPTDAKGTYSIGIEGRLGITINPGTEAEHHGEYGGVNKVAHFSVDGTPVAARREVVSIEQCNACHGDLRFHGQNRNRIEQCVLCHNASETDASRRPADQKPDQTVHMAYMIHRIHAGAQVEGEYTVYGFGNVAHDFSHVGYPARLSRCSMCHVNNSQQIDGKEGLPDVTNPRGLINPTPPITAACGSCHTGVAAWSHALANTTQLGESCSACHGASREFSVDKSHAF
jgi:OmcA/MtrC family decaheme c-type cytochrome